MSSFIWMLLFVKFSIYHIFIASLLEKTLRWKFSILSHGIQAWFILCQTTCFNIPSIIKIKIIWSIFCFWVHKYITFIFTNMFQFPNYKMKWNNFFSNILPRLYSNIICKNIVKIFQKFEMGYTQTCTSLENNTMWHPKGGHHIVFFPWNNVLLFQVPLCHQKVHDS